jgi:hypothetical protein
MGGWRIGSEIMNARELAEKELATLQENLDTWEAYAYHGNMLEQQEAHKRMAQIRERMAILDEVIKEQP